MNHPQTAAPLALLNQAERSKPALVQDSGRMSVANVVQQTMAIQEVMKAVMKQGVHYGVIKGTDKPTLYKAGAEKLCLAFHIADEYHVEDLSTGSDAIRYRVTCVGRHQHTGIQLGTGLGEASTSEEKYRWRAAVCDPEFNDTPANMRRTKYGKSKGGGFYTAKQVRTEPSDLANTVLKMAAKRAKMAMVLNVLAASDAFTQDLEDLSDELREHLTDGEQAAASPVAARPEPQVWPADAFATQLVRWDKAVAAGIKTPADILAMARSKGALTPEQEAQILALKKAAVPADDPFVADMERAERAQGGAQ